MKYHFYILISVITFCLTSCQLLIHKKCNEQKLSEDLEIMERRMDSTDYQNLKKGLCQIKFEGGDIQDYTYYKVKEFWSHHKSYRKHDIHITINSINESVQLADSLGCENWKNNIKEHIMPMATHTWTKPIYKQHNLIPSLIELGKTNDDIINDLVLDSFVVSNAFTFIQTEELITNIEKELNEKIDSLRSL
ncbi:MAG: hypothetical protein P8H59_12975 [Flavobacteriales bacterium]|nr:hypothetical protein [Flavobacteriales bacterium]